MGKNNEFKRVLVVSHNPFSDTQNNGKTLSSFFNNWPPEKIAQLYFTPETPDVTVCENFFRVTDWDVLRKFFGLRQELEGKIEGAPTASEVALRDKFSKNLILKMGVGIYFSRLPLALMFRSFFWKSHRWESKDLLSWLDDFDPEVIFFQTSNCTFAFDVVDRISKLRKTPVVLQTTDDYLTPRGSGWPFSHMQIAELTTRYRRLARYANGVIAISGQMAREYSAIHGGEYFVAMNSVSEVNQPSSRNHSKNVLDFVYAGNLGLRRWRTLVALAKSLNEIKAQGGPEARLSIYSLLPPTGLVGRAFSRQDLISYEGSLNSEELRVRLTSADFLVHVEAFDKKSRATTRLSISTKVPEYMASGTPIIAIGPAGVASIQYLEEIEGATVIHDSKVSVIKRVLNQALKDTEVIEARRESALSAAKRNHLQTEIQSLVRRLVDA